MASSTKSSSSSATTQPIKRIRKEIRTLSNTEWNNVVKAFWVMKLTNDNEGKRKYGNRFISYDRLVLKHGISALDDRGDQAHFGPVFNTYHRAFIREAENSLLAINPSISGLPYWDSSSQTSIFTKKYFGSLIGAGQGYVVNNGAFKNWPIAETNKLSSPSGSMRVSNSFGLLRHPLNINSAKYATRRGGLFCGEEMPFNLQTDSWDKCLSIKENDINRYIACVNPNLHGPIHMMVAGTWKRSDQKSESNDCAQWFSVIQVPFPMKSTCSNQEDCEDSSIIYIQGYGAGCFQCPQCSTYDETANCMCAVQDRCESLYDSLNAVVATDLMAPQQQISILGDFADSVASVNDPVFLFFHCNMDRHFQHWIVQNFSSQTLKSTNYYHFTTNGYDGTNLDDIINSKDPFIDIFNSSKLSKSKRQKLFARNKKLTHRDILDLTSPLTIDYTYDSIIQMQQNSVERHYVRGLKPITPEITNYTSLEAHLHVRGFALNTPSRSLESTAFNEFRIVGSFVYICIILVILLLCIPYLIYFFCLKYCHPRTDTIETFEYTSSSCDNDIVDETREDEIQQENQDTNQNETKQKPDDETKDDEDSKR